ncbi:MAG: metallophosphoesterase family protein, partial [Acidimicrobiia bacterium]
VTTTTASGPATTAPTAPPTTPAPGPPVAPFEIGILGDTGYSSSQDDALLEIREDMNGYPLAFTVHAGDIWAEGTPCTDENYRRVANVFDGFAHPFVYTPGDNEWTDCNQSSSGRLDSIRDIFFPTDQTLGRVRASVARQAEAPENARWSAGGVVFATINEPGADGRGGSHRDRNLAWLDAAFDQAEASGAPGVMIIWQDNPFEPSGGRLYRRLKERTELFARPVVLVHGDTHDQRIDHPWDDVPNFTRVETYGDTSSAVWIRGIVSPSTPWVFDFDKEHA